MCEFCVKHGDGEKWYLTMENYSRELLEQDDRLGYMLHFANTFEERVPGDLAMLARIKRSPLRTLARPFFERSQRINHFGQVVPIEEIVTILRRVDGIATIPFPEAGETEWRSMRPIRVVGAGRQRLRLPRRRR